MFYFLLLCVSCSSQDSSPQAKQESSFVERSVSSAMWNVASIETYQKKVDEIIGAHQATLSRRDVRVPLLLVLGSSSSGGGTKGNNMKFWPEILRRELPNVHVHSLARGGATTWHMRKVMEGLEVKADICIVYMGYNDRQQKSPKQSIAQLEEGQAPKTKGFVAWVSPQEQKRNLEGIQKYCTNILLVREYVQEKKNIRDPYKNIFSSIKGARTYDPFSMFSKEEPKIVMMDNIHPTPFGHQLLAEEIIKQMSDWLP